MRCLLQWATASTSDILPPWALKACLAVCIVSIATLARSLIRKTRRRRRRVVVEQPAEVVQPQLVEIKHEKAEPEPVEHSESARPHIKPYRTRRFFIKL